MYADLLAGFSFGEPTTPARPLIETEYPKLLPGSELVTFAENFEVLNHAVRGFRHARTAFSVSLGAPRSTTLPEVKDERPSSAPPGWVGSNSVVCVMSIHPESGSTKTYPAPLISMRSVQQAVDFLSLNLKDFRTGFPGRAT